MIPEFKRYPSWGSTLATFALLLDIAEINTEFSGGDHYSVLFNLLYTLEGVTAMPRELHARLCHAFLVTFVTIPCHRLSWRFVAHVKYFKSNLNRLT